ncbi:unnamed protein product [Clonostachys solani]|uniref:Rhodopsin domain-containing protein n=1 Tax=Clonostachys solani TaxID=160281 RepID=A0A9N9Z877_9HYPO|nr:unnamed protein product [Clonostachys solani]
MESQVYIHWTLLGITFAFATIAILLRVLSRVLTRLKFWWDDWLAITCYIIDVVWLIIIIIWVQKGLGKHVHDVTWGPIEDVLTINKLLLYVAELFYAFALFFGKVSILAFYWRMFGVTNIKLPIQILLGCSIVWIIIRTFMGIWHCVPIHAFWDSNAGGYCAIDDSKFFFGTILVHVLIDLAILSLPVMQIYKLNLPLMQKIGVMLMFGFGVFICVAAVAIIVESVNFDAKSIDFTWNISSIVFWATIEVPCYRVRYFTPPIPSFANRPSLPTFRPALNFIFKRKLPGSSAMESGGASHGLSHRGRISTKNMTAIPSEADETASTYELADVLHGEGSSNGGFEHHAIDKPFGVATVISGDTQSNKFRKESHDEEGILVKNTMTIKISRREDSPTNDGLEEDNVKRHSRKDSY